MSTALHRIGSRELEISATNGTVAQANKRSEVHTTGHIGSRYDPITDSRAATGSISSTSVVYDDIFLVDDAGKEHDIHAWGLDVACREGHRLSVSWVRPAGSQKKWQLLRIRNHTTGSTWNTLPKNLRDMLRPRHRWAFLGAGIVELLWILGGSFDLITPVLAWLALEGCFTVVSTRRAGRLLREFDFTTVETPGPPSGGTAAAM